MAQQQHENIVRYDSMGASIVHLSCLDIFVFHGIIIALTAQLAAGQQAWICAAKSYPSNHLDHKLLWPSDQSTWLVCKLLLLACLVGVYL